MFIICKIINAAEAFLKKDAKDADLPTIQIYEGNPVFRIREMRKF